MYLIMWDLHNQDIPAAIVNEAFVRYELPALAENDTQAMTFRQAYRKFSSMRSRRFQTQVISDSKIAIVARSDQGEAVNLKHECNLTVDKKNIYYICMNCGSYINVLNTSFKTCQTCGHPVPEPIEEIITKYHERLNIMSNEGRSAFYTSFIRLYLNAVSFLSSGRPYIIHESKIEQAKNFKKAVDDIGDRVFIIKSEDDKEALRIGLLAEIEQIKEECQKLSRESSKEKRLTALDEIRMKIKLYESSLGVISEELQAVSEEVKNQILKDIING